MGNKYDAAFQQADAAFDGQYKTQLQQLLGLSKEELTAITPSATDMKVYHALIKIVSTASQNNESQAALINNIKQLGQTGIDIAKKVPALAALL